MKALLLLFLAIPVKKKYISPCDMNWNMLNLNQQIELSIGCSEVNGKRVYPDWRLDEVFEGLHPKNR